MGKLDGKVSKSKLFYCTEIKGSANNKIIKNEFQKSLKLLFNKNINFENIFLIISDQAKYMLKFVNKLKKSKLYPNLMHVSCLAHCLHRVCEKIRSIFNKTDNLVNYFKKYLKPLNIQKLFKSQTKLKLPPRVITTRWCSWLKAVIYFNDNFFKIKKFINSNNFKINSYLRNVRFILNSKNYKRELNKLYKYKFLVPYIAKLEDPSLSAPQAFQLIKNTKSYIKDKNVLKKLNNSLAKNPDIYTLINKIKTNNDLLFSPLVSVDVERSFSILKCISNSKPNIASNNLKKHIVIKYNSDSKFI